MHTEPSLRLSHRIVVIGLMALLASTTAACSRERYHLAADQNVYELIGEKGLSPRWALPNYTINTNPRSRYFDPTNPDRPPMPQDDPYSHIFMHSLAGMKHSKHWHDDGDYHLLENPSWRRLLGCDVRFSENGSVYLTLNDAVRLAQIHSGDYRDSIETLYLSALDVSAERFRFQTQFFGGTGPTFTHIGRQRAGGETNTLNVSSNLTVRRRFATGADLLIGFANSFVWQFAGPDTNATSSLLNFSIIQPLLRAGGKKVALETLTIAERTLLANLRAFERYRHGFYTNLAIGDGGTAGPQRRGGFFGGTGLTGFTGQGAGGFGGVGGGTFGGAGRLGGGGGGGGAAGFAGGGEGSLGGFVGLLQTMQSIRNSEDNLQAQLRTLTLLEANLDAGLIDIAQVDQFRQNIETERARLLQAQIGFQNALDAYKAQLGLPPDIPMELDDSMIDRFQFRDDSLLSKQQDLLTVVDSIGEKEGTLPPAELKKLLTELEKEFKEVRGLFKMIEDDLAALEKAVPSRERGMSPEEKKLFEGDRRRLAESVVDIKKVLDQLEKDFKAIQGQAGTAKPEAMRIDTVAIFNRLASVVQELSLVQARARLETVVLDRIEVTAEQALAIARANRLDWMNNRASLVDTWRLIAFNANALLSNVDITFSGDMGTIGDNPVRFRAANGSLRAGLRFDAPLTRLLERNNFRQSLISYHQDRRQLMQFHDTVYANMRRSVRQLERLEQNLEIQRKAVVIAVRRVDQTRESLNEPPPPVQPGQTNSQTFGPTAALNLLQALSDLRNSQDNFISVWLAYYGARMLIIREMGIMELDACGIWCDTPFNAADWEAVGPCPLPPEIPPAWLEEMGVDPNDEQLNYPADSIHPDDPNDQPVPAPGDWQSGDKNFADDHPSAPGQTGTGGEAGEAAATSARRGQRQPGPGSQAPRGSAHGAAPRVSARSTGRQTRVLPRSERPTSNANDEDSSMHVANGALVLGQSSDRDQQQVLAPPRTAAVRRVSAEEPAKRRSLKR